MASDGGLKKHCNPQFVFPAGEGAFMVAHHGKFVAYYRVSTDKQGIDG